MGWGGRTVGAFWTIVRDLLQRNVVAFKLEYSTSLCTRGQLNRISLSTFSCRLLLTRNVSISLYWPRRALCLPTTRCVGGVKMWMEKISLIFSESKDWFLLKTIWNVMNTTLDTVSSGTLLMDDPGGFWSNGKGCAMFDYDYDVNRGGWFGFFLGCFLLVFYHIASMTKK